MSAPNIHSTSLVALPMHEVILLVFNCQAYRHKAQQQRDTWLPNIHPIPYYHVLGNPDLPTPFVFDHESRILWVNTPDDYVSLPKKVIAAFHAVYQSFTFRYLFKTDDDQHLTMPSFLTTLTNLLRAKQPTVHYAGNIVEVSDAYLSQYHRMHPELPANLPVLPTRYCSGRFYALSALAVQWLLSKRPDIEAEYLEDYAVGLHLHPVLKQHMMHVQTDKYFVDADVAPPPSAE